MKLSDIKPGMIVTSNVAGAPRYRIIEQMTYMLNADGTSKKDKAGRVIEVDNSLRNKWFVRDITKPDEPMVAACFSQDRIEDGTLVFQDGAHCQAGGEMKPNAKPFIELLVRDDTAKKLKLSKRGWKPDCAEWAGKAGKQWAEKDAAEKQRRVQ